MGGGINVYYSTILSPFKHRWKSSSGRALLSPNSFALIMRWVGYHAILQEQARSDEAGVEGDVLERLLESDRAPFARMQVRQATRTGVDAASNACPDGCIRFGMTAVRWRLTGGIFRSKELKSTAFNADAGVENGWAQSPQKRKNSR
jgi:hypothetical protein